MKEEIKHIFDRSACLNKRQVEAYLAGNMITEEVYAVEHHINGCPLCSMCMDGMQLRKDALEVTSGLNGEFLKTHLQAIPEPSTGGAAAYVKNNLKPEALKASPAATALKFGIAVAACAGILWLVQQVGGDKKDKEVAKTEEAIIEGNNSSNNNEEGSVVVEEPLTAETQTISATDTEPAPVETALIEEAPATTTAAKKEEPKPAAAAKPEVSTKPATTAKPVIGPPPMAKTTPEKKPVVPPAKTPEKKPTTPPVAAKKTEPAKTEKPAPPPPPPVVREVPKEQPKPVVREEPKPAPKVEEPKPEPKPVAKKEEPAEELPSDPIAAGKALMDKRNYNAAINKMRNEMRSNNKNRRQEAVMLVARCYQAMGNKDRAKELLSSIVDEGGPEKKAAKKALKEVDKDAKEE